MKHYPITQILILNLLSSLIIIAASINSILQQQESPSSFIQDEDLPPILDADDISYFFSEFYNDGSDGDVLYDVLKRVFERSIRNVKRKEDDDDDNVLQQSYFDLSPNIVSRGGGFTYTTAYKLKMDLEQAQYLSQTIHNKTISSFFREKVVPVYSKVLNNIPPLGELERTAGLYSFTKKDYDLGIGNFYNRALFRWGDDIDGDNDDDDDDDNNNDHHHDTTNKRKHILSSSLLSDTFPTDLIEAKWFGEDIHNNNNNNIHSNEGLSLSRPGVVIIDNLLTPTALQSIRKILLQNTVFYQTKMPLRFGGYAGAYLDDGLHDRILVRLSYELHKKLPRIMENHPLRYLWAYRYDSEYEGINIHADQAAVNVNIWLSPDDANLGGGATTTTNGVGEGEGGGGGENGGGLVVYTARPPSDWDFEKYNTDVGKAIREVIEPTGYANVTVPYRENRAVLFDSMLFHRTDAFKFKNGFTNRRINLTLLYGTMPKNRVVEQEVVAVGDGGGMTGSGGIGIKDDL